MTSDNDDGPLAAPFDAVSRAPQGPRSGLPWTPWQTVLRSILIIIGGHRLVWLLGGRFGCYAVTYRLDRADRSAQDLFRIGLTNKAPGYRLPLLEVGGIDLGLFFERLGSAARPNEVQPGAKPRDSSFGAVATKTTQAYGGRFGVAKPGSLPPRRGLVHVVTRVSAASTQAHSLHPTQINL